MFGFSTFATSFESISICGQERFTKTKSFSVNITTALFPYFRVWGTSFPNLLEGSFLQSKRTNNKLALYKSRKAGFFRKQDSWNGIFNNSEWCAFRSLSHFDPPLEIFAIKLSLLLFLPEKTLALTLILCDNKVKSFRITQTGLNTFL